MGHIVDADREYRLLQRRLDRTVTGVPESATFLKILKLLFSPEDAELARRLPGRPTPLGALSRKLDIPRDELQAKLSEMAHRGLVVDLIHGGEWYFALPPVVIGFFELTFMRTREDLPVVDLARLFEEYFNESDRFARSVYQGQTQIGRRLIWEETLPQGDHIEILDWERASHIVQSASVIGVSLCPCRRELSHLGRACDRPGEVCLSLNYAAESLIRNGIARPITIAEALRILGQCKEAGLAQTGDNVQRKAAYICNCCGCCCGMIRAMKTYDIRSAIVSSNWMMEIDLTRCTGCGQCVTMCPMEAIDIVEEGDETEKRKWAVREATLCLGCGICYSVCKRGAITMKYRAQRVFVPQTVFDRIVGMAIERGKLADLVFDDPERLSHRALGRVVNALERSPPFKAAMAIQPLRSAFLSVAVKGARKVSGRIAEVVG